ncbi:MAG: hypothetical protein BWZ08_00622 [candidate division BRC1 bacterium ADurb.BinA292]|nr:MAG: hypothetical protein BWZ08_00622 [candidate division BRC1 bacterium ADurb.BinA292]
MLDPWPPFENSEYYPIATYNIFDPKTVQDAGALEQRANEKYNQAYIAYQQRNLAGALQYVNEALQIAPNHRAARQMLEKLNAEMQPAATDGASSPTAGGG